MTKRALLLAPVLALLPVVGDAWAGDPAPSGNQRPPSTGSGSGNSRPPSTGSGSSSSGGNERPPSTGSPCTNPSSPEAALFAAAPTLFAQREASGDHTGVEALYDSLSEKAQPGTPYCIMRPEFHISGGRVAFDRGEIGVARARYVRARDLSFGPAQAFIATIDTLFAPVDVAPQPGTAELKFVRPAHMPVTTPSAVASLLRANIQLKRTRKFTGWLPVGPYTIEPSSPTKAFVVVPSPTQTPMPVP